MNTSLIYIAVSIVVLAVIAVLLFLVKKNKKESRLSPLAGLAFVCVLAGIIYGGNRIVGYSLLGIGALLAVIDLFNKSKD